MLEGIGLTVEQEEIYLGMLVHPPRTMDEIVASHAGRNRESTAAVVASLVEAGLAATLAGTPERYLATAPDVAIEGLARARVDQAERVRQAVPALMEQLWVAQDPAASADFIEILTSESAFVRRWNQLMRTATYEVRIFDRPPYYNDPLTPNAEELQRLSDAVPCRAIYAQSALDLPGRWPSIEASIAAGEEARVLSDLPAKLVLHDDTTAILSMQSDPAGRPISVILVHRSALLDALSALFEAHWQQAIPITSAAARPATADVREEQLVRLLAAGMGDDTIQRTLGVSASTVHRRVHELMQRLGARTRFQAGYQLARTRHDQPH